MLELILIGARHDEDLDGTRPLPDQEVWLGYIARPLVTEQHGLGCWNCLTPLYTPSLERSAWSLLEMLSLKILFDHQH